MALSEGNLAIKMRYSTECWSGSDLQSRSKQGMSAKVPNRDSLTRSTHIEMEYCGKGGEK